MSFPGEGLLGGLVGGALSYKGAKEANKMNLQIAREQMGFQERSADKAMGFGQSSAREQMDFQRQMSADQMGFQERMSNTSYQRAVEDMKRAGINPIMAFQQGGASTPPGSTAGGSSAQGVSASGSRAHMVNVLGTMVNSAFSAMSSIAQAKQAESLTQLMRLQVPERKAEASFYETTFGKYTKGAGEIGKSILPFLKMFVPFFH